MKDTDLTGQESEILNRIDLSQALARALARNREGLRFVATAGALSAVRARYAPLANDFSDRSYLRRVRVRFD